MALNYTLTISDPGSLLGSSNSSLILKDIGYVMSYIGQYITFQKPLDLQIVVKPASDNKANTDGLLPSIPAWVTDGGKTTLAAIVKGQTGVDPNGALPDAGFTIYLGNDGTIKNYGAPVWLDPNPQLGIIPTLPNGSHDFISIATHELFHCFGFATWPEQNAPWNQHTMLQNNSWYYSSPTLNNLLGGPLPLAPDRPADDHYGNANIAYRPVMSGLMYQFGNYLDNRFDIGQVDLLILKDLGWTIQNYQSLPLVDPLDKYNIVGTDGNDTLHASEFSSIISAAAGADTIVLPGGTRNGNYLIDGGPGTDTLQVPQLSSQFNIVRYGSDFLLQSKDGSQGVSLLHSTEAIQFNDKTMTLAAPSDVISTATIQGDYLGIVRLALPLDQATTVASAINAGTQTEVQYINSLLLQVANTTIPAVAVEASMYGVVGTSAQLTSLATSFLPAQVANAMANGYYPIVYASEALGLALSFGNKAGTAFADTFGPSSSSMPNSAAGDAAFASAAATAIFSSASTSNIVNAIQNYVVNWKSFYTLNGIPGNPNPTAEQIDLAARGASWGDAVGVALDNKLGSLYAQTVDFLKDAAQGTAIYSASLASQPKPGLFQGEALAALTSDLTIGLTGAALDPMLI